MNCVWFPTGCAKARLPLPSSTPPTKGPSERETRPFSPGPRPGQGGGPGRDRRDARSNGGGGDRPRGDGRRPGPGGARGGGDRRDGRPGDTRPPRDFAPAARPAPPAPVRVIFQPDELCLTSIIKQIRSTHLAYPLFSLGADVPPGTGPPLGTVHGRAGGGAGRHDALSTRRRGTRSPSTGRRWNASRSTRPASNITPSRPSRRSR